MNSNDIDIIFMYSLLSIFKMREKYHLPVLQYKVEKSASYGAGTLANN